MVLKSITGLEKRAETDGCVRHKSKEERTDVYDEGRKVWMSITTVDLAKHYIDEVVRDKQMLASLT